MSTSVTSPRTEFERMPIAGKQKISVLYLQLGTTIFAGIERVVDTICAELAKNHADDFDVDVLRVSQHENYPAEPRFYRSVMRPVTSRLGLLRTFRRVVQEKHYDLVVIPQIEPTVIFWFARLGIKQKITTHLHGNPHHENSHFKARIMFFAMKHLVAGRIASMFGTSPRQLKAFARDFNYKGSMFWVPNPVRRFEEPAENEKPNPDVITFVNVGRFDRQKGQDILIDAFAKLYKRRKDVRLSLVGYGSDEPMLADRIRRLGLSDVAKLVYYPVDPQRALFESDIYVATSRWEGWCLAICEALRCGLPVVSTDCDFGPSDILVDRRLGHLVPPGDEDALVEAMQYYCENLAEERAFDAYRRENIDQYSVEKTAKIHADAIRRSVARPLSEEVARLKPAAS